MSRRRKLLPLSVGLAVHGILVCFPNWREEIVQKVQLVAEGATGRGYTIGGEAQAVVEEAALLD